MKGMALCCGINKFAHPGHDLRGCVADAATMDSVFLHMGLSVNDIQVLTDNQVTKTNVLTILKDIRDKAHDLDFVGFTYSAHGTHGVLPEGGLFEAICCYDIHEDGDDWDYNTLIKDTELKDLLNSFPSTCLVEVWLDTCFSGGMDRLMNPKVRSKFLHNPGNTEGLLRMADSRIHQGLNPNVVLWAACSEAQTSADAYLEGGPHGAFTYFWRKNYQKDKGRVPILVDTRNDLRTNGFDQLPRLKAWSKETQEPVGR